MRQLLWKNAFTRKTFSGASIFYNALLDGMVNGGKNPFFYVSSSDWNLYDLLVDFCDLHKIPKGVFMLNLGTCANPRAFCISTEFIFDFSFCR